MGGSLSCKRKKIIYFKPSEYPYHKSVYSNTEFEAIVRKIKISYKNSERNDIKHHNKNLITMTNPSNKTDINKLMTYIRQLTNIEIYQNLDNVLFGYRYIQTKNHIIYDKFGTDTYYVNIMGMTLINNSRDSDKSLLLLNLISLDPDVLNYPCIAIVDSYSNNVMKDLPLVNVDNILNYNREINVSMYNFNPMLLATELRLPIDIVITLLNNNVKQLYYVLNTYVNLKINNNEIDEEFIKFIKIIFEKIRLSNEITELNVINNLINDFTNLKRHIGNSFDIKYSSMLFDEFDFMDSYLMDTQHQSVCDHIIKISRLTELSVIDLKNNECCICLGNRTECCMGITNCGHFICSICFHDLQKRECPICHTSIENDSITYYK